MKFKVIACDTLREEIGKILQEGVELKSFRSGLHRFPEELRQSLKEEIDKSDGIDYILLGYGLCAGLRDLFTSVLDNKKRNIVY